MEVFLVVVTIILMVTSGKRIREKLVTGFGFISINVSLYMYLNYGTTIILSTFKSSPWGVMLEATTHQYLHLVHIEMYVLRLLVMEVMEEQRIPVYLNLHYL